MTSSGCETVVVYDVLPTVMIAYSPQNTMLRHTENCTGEDVEENGSPPKKSRRGRKRKMQARKDDDDDDDDTGIVFCSVKNSI